MPTYEYACDACGHRFEEFQSITAKPIKRCPVCKKNKVKRLISAGGGFIFKGSGFYITDYRSDNYKAGEKSASGEGTKTDAKTDSAKTDAKPQTAPAEGKTAKPAEPAPAAKPAAKTTSKKK